ncbi:hypothetical protein INR49_013712, partial [Caranx melampygus]
MTYLQPRLLRMRNTCTVAMNRSFAPHLVRPNLPLRKPSSSPVAIATASTPLRPFIRPGATSLSPLPICFGE